MNSLCTGTRGDCCVLSRSGTMGAHKSGTSSHEMMLPGGSEANGRRSGNCCPGDPLLQCGTFSVSLKTGQGMEIYGQSQLSILFTCQAAALVIGKCQWMFVQEPSRAPLGCLPWEGHFFQGHLLRTKDCCAVMRTVSPLSSSKAAWLGTMH